MNITEKKIFNIAIFLTIFGAMSIVLVALGIISEENPIKWFELLTFTFPFAFITKFIISIFKKDE